MIGAIMYRDARMLLERVYNDEEHGVLIERVSKKWV